MPETFSQEAISLMMAMANSGQPFHVETLRRFQGKTGADEIIVPVPKANETILSIRGKAMKILLGLVMGRFNVIPQNDKKPCGTC